GGQIYISLKLNIKNASNVLHTAILTKVPVLFRSCCLIGKNLKGVEGSCLYFQNDFYPVDSHLTNMVEIDGKTYITDVSYGVSCQLWYPLEMISGKDQPQPPGVFRLLNNGMIWVLEKTSRKQVVKDKANANSSLIDRRLVKTMYCFPLTPRNKEHFVETLDCLQTSPDSRFVLKSICSLQTPNGFRALIGWTYSEITYNPEEDSDMVDMKEIPDSEIEAVLKEKFNVVLVNKLTPKNKKANYCIITI
uniref:arylamine N-acetyltransferase n=1 Tax=Sinocyclocheilus rhinocerous TaxID=307959 RepID=A0A673HEN9_9TELE